MRELRQHFRLQLVEDFSSRRSDKCERRLSSSMSAPQPGAATAAQLSPLRRKTQGFLRIAKHGGGITAVYVVTYHRLNQRAEGSVPKPALAEGAQALIELLERIGIDFSSREVRDALVDVLRFGSANIPDLWLSDEEMIEKGLVEA